MADNLNNNIDNFTIADDLYVPNIEILTVTFITLT